MTDRLLRGLAVVVAVIATGGVILSQIAFRESGSDFVSGLAWPVTNIIVGALLTIRRPRLLTGWLFAGIGFFGAVGEAGRLVGLAGASGSPAWWVTAGAWMYTWAWIPLLYLTLIFLPLLFPDGRPPSRRWRPVTAAIVLIAVGATLLASVQETLDLGVDSGPTIVNPLGIAGVSDIEEGATGPVLFVLTALSLVIALAALIVRYRRSAGAERQQLKWFTSAGVLLIVGFVLQGALDGMTGRRIEIIDIALFTLPPAAAAVAIMRYRLYAIDRIISRTVTYATVTAVLIAVYLALVTVLTAMTAPVTGDSPVAVAAATLAAAALFRPARRRVQAVVDRRFNRAQYDASRTVEAFRDQMRDDVDLDRLTTDLLTTTQQVLQPATTAVWLRPTGGRP